MKYLINYNQSVTKKYITIFLISFMRNQCIYKYSISDGDCDILLREQCLQGDKVTVNVNTKFLWPAIFRNGFIWDIISLGWGNLSHCATDNTVVPSEIMCPGNLTPCDLRLWSVVKSSVNTL